MSERRYVTHEFETRAVSDSVATIEGYAAVFEKRSQLLGLGNGFLEEVSKGAFKKTIKEADVRALVNHDPSFLLGRTKSGTLRLAEDSTGLHYEVDIDLENSDSRNAYRMIERGDMSQSSFSFDAIEDVWDFPSGEPAVRTLKAVRLHDVSPVTYPAYLDATIDVQPALRSLAKDTGTSLEVLEAAIETRSLREVLTDDTQEEGAPATSHALTIMRRRLDLDSKKLHPLLVKGIK